MTERERGRGFGRSLGEGGKRAETERGTETETETETERGTEDQRDTDWILTSSFKVDTVGDTGILLHVLDQRFDGFVRSQAQNLW